MVTKAALEVMLEAKLLQAFEKDFCSCVMTGSSLGRRLFWWRDFKRPITDQVRKL